MIHFPMQIFHISAVYVPFGMQTLTQKKATTAKPYFSYFLFCFFVIAFFVGLLLYSTVQQLVGIYWINRHGSNDS